MGRMAMRALAKAAIACIAAIAGASSMAQGPLRGDTSLPPIAQSGPGPEFRASRPMQLAPAVDGPTREAPLSFGRSRAIASDQVAPAAPQEAGTGDGPDAGRSVESKPAPTAAALAAGVVPAGAGRVGEAKALARLRARLEETLARHASIDARVNIDRNAVRVVSRGPDAPPAPGSNPARVDTPALRKSTTAPARRATGRSTERPAGPRDWSYWGDTGPAHWASLNPEWAACGAQAPQSPIDIRDGIAVGLPTIEFDLPPATLTIRDDGRAIRAVVREGPAIEALGRRFELREISFHQPAEFRVEARSFDLSAQMLYRDGQGRAAVVVVLFEVGDESSPRNPVVQTVLDYLPLAQGMLMPVAGRTDLDPLLPADRGYYNFVGSLSSPPCTEGVVWMVMREPLRVPPSQVAIFARVHPMNVRPLQPLAGRLIKQSE